jgi:hypothetical protein
MIYKIALIYTNIKSDYQLVASVRGFTNCRKTRLRSGLDNRKGNNPVGLNNTGLATYFYLDLIYIKFLFKYFNSLIPLVFQRNENISSIFVA